MAGGVEVAAKDGRAGRAWRTDEYEDSEEGRSRRIVALLAGYAAERRHMRDRGESEPDPRLHAESDFEKVRDWYSDGETEADWLDRARAFVDVEWKAIEAVALELVERRRLDADEIDLVVMAADGEPRAAVVLAELRGARERRDRGEGAETMKSDTMGTMYDDETAVHFASQRTGIDGTTCAAVLRSRDRFHVGLGITADDVEVFGNTSDEIRAMAPALFPSSHVGSEGKMAYVDPGNERAFVVLDAKIDASTVAAVLHADEEYMRKLGLIEDAG